MPDRSHGRRRPSGSPSRSANPAPDAEHASWLRDQGSSQVIPRFDFRVDFCSATAPGGARDQNEDALLCDPSAAVFGVADGMSGHRAGEVAATLALDVAAQQLRSKQCRRRLDKYALDPTLENRRAVFGVLEDAIGAANEAVVRASRQSEQRKGMGSTLDIVVLVRDRAFVAHVGDARAYLVRPTATLQLTHDHAAYDSLQTSGKRTRACRWVRSPLTNCIGADSRVTVDTLFVDLSTGDQVILCTDGVFASLDDDVALARQCGSGIPQETCQQLIAGARRVGGYDDASVLVLRIGDRFVRRRADAGPRALDMAVVSASPLLVDLPPSAVLSTLAASVELEIERGREVPRTVANDRVAYLILDGLVRLPTGRILGASGLLMAESLLDVSYRDEPPIVTERARLLRIRHDDFTEVCSHDAELAAQLYQRLARHLARV